MNIYSMNINSLVKLIAITIIVLVLLITAIVCSNDSRYSHVVKAATTVIISVMLTVIYFA